MGVFGGGGGVEGGGFTKREIVSISYITSLKSITYVCIFYLQWQLYFDLRCDKVILFALCLEEKFFIGICL